MKLCDNCGQEFGLDKKHDEVLDTLTADRDKWKAMAVELGDIVKDYNGYYIGAHREVLAKLKEMET